MFFDFIEDIDLAGRVYFNPNRIRIFWEILSAKCRPSTLA